MPDKNVEVPGLGVVSFPDSMSDDQVNAAIKAQLAPPQAEQTSGYSKLTANYNPQVEDWAEKHPVLGPVMRFLDKTGGAFIGAPEAIGRFANDISNHHGQQTAEQIAESLHEWFTNPNVRKSAVSLLPEALGEGVGSVAGAEALGAGIRAVPKAPPITAATEALSDARAGLSRAVRNPRTGKIMSPYEMAIDKLLPDQNAPQAAPAKAIPKGTNYGQYLEDQKAAAKAAAKQQAADAANPAGKPILPGGKIVDPNSAPLPINTTYVSQPRLRLVELAKKGNIDALRELERNPGGIDIETAVPNAKFLLDSSKRVIYGGPTE